MHFWWWDQSVRRSPIRSRRLGPDYRSRVYLKGVQRLDKVAGLRFASIDLTLDVRASATSDLVRDLLSNPGEEHGRRRRGAAAGGGGGAAVPGVRQRRLVPTRAVQHREPDSGGRHLRPHGQLRQLRDAAGVGARVAPAHPLQLPVAAAGRPRRLPPRRPAADGDGAASDCKCLLSHDLNTDEPDAADPCVVVVFDLAGTGYWFCHVERDTKWQHRSYMLATLNTEGRHQKWNMAREVGMAAVGGKIYCELSEHELGVLEFDPVDTKPTLTRIKVDMVRIPSGFPTWLRYFIESCGELFLVIVYFRSNCRRKVARVALYKMDFSALAWCRVDHIGNRVFLLCGDRSGLSRFGASCSTSDHGLTANRIYFFNGISHLQNTLHIFDLTNKSEEEVVPFNFGISPVRPPFWMLPIEKIYERQFNSIFPRRRFNRSSVHS
ncbi:hypothetical protein ACP4OV_016599 [Aristida adscensionis]